MNSGQAPITKLFMLLQLLALLTVVLALFSYVLAFGARLNFSGSYFFLPSLAFVGSLVA